MTLGRGAASSRISVEPICLAVSLAEFRKWLRAARPGAEFTYAVGRSLDRQHKVVQFVRESADQGDVHLLQRRRSDGKTDYFARRVASAKPSPAPSKQTQALDPESEAGRVLGMLRRHANFERPCPTNAEIAKALGLGEPARARYLIGQLTSAGHIKVDNRGARITRVVTIVENGKRTSDARLAVGKGFTSEGQQ
ncbi:MAG TPA: hypothetical protein VF503_20725 [Sphingobium sp.]|uniref:hypothetical protein n=1 Tax=Sphingobium sp. TaxID=1912891 RepID=UPI002ED19A2C